MKHPTIMVKLSVDRSSDFMGIKTYDRPHGSRGRFLIARDTLFQILSEPNSAVHYESDCGHYAEVWHSGDHLRFRITWLSLYANGTVKGFQQMIAIPDKMAEPLLASGGHAKLLYAPFRAPTSIETSPLAAETIHNFMHNKCMRRAFSKAMRDCFDWPGDRIMLHRDGKYSFYFTTWSGFPKCGGLILHESERNGHPCLYYSVHT